MSAPLVSVLIPTYNGAAHLAEAVRSACAQTHADLEVLVGDDASTDGSAEVAEAAAQGDGRVRVVRHPRNLGAFENPIALLREARGQWIKFLLHDDVLAPECVAELLAGVAGRPDVRLALAKRGVIDGRGRRLPDPPEVVALVAGPRLVDGRTLADAMLRLGVNLVGELSTVLLRRDVFDLERLWRLDGRPLAANGDFALFLECLAAGPAFVTPRELSCFRVHDGQRSQSEAIVIGGLEDWPRLIDDAQGRLGLLADPGSASTAWTSVAARTGSLLAQLPLSAPSRARAQAVAAQAWSRIEGPAFEAAVATPLLDVDAVRATLAALRAVAPISERLQIAVAPERVEEAIALIEPVLAEGPDVDVLLTPSARPLALLGTRRLAVVAGPGEVHRPWAA